MELWKIKPGNWFITLAAIASISLIAISCKQKTELTGRPNILVIMADDLGYADVGFNGCKDIPTPNIDGLAASGARFSSGYVTAPICGPSRAGFITGRIQSTFGWYGNPSAPLDPKQGLPPNIKTIAHFMQEQGYVTGGIGKWHMGTADNQHPNVLGYSDWFGFLSGGHTYYPINHPSYQGKYSKMPKPWGIRDMHHTLPVLHNHEPVKWEQYLTRELTDQGIAFLVKNQDKPFFLFMSYNAPHEDLEAPEESIAKFPPEDMTVIPGVKPGSRSIYSAMTYELDMGVGKLMEKLDHLGLAENTLVWFLSDNGGMRRTSDNRPLRGTKGSEYEGGLRVPFVVRWPGHVKPGIVLDAPVTSLDIGATSVALAGVDLSGADLDGVDITAYITGEETVAPHKELYWRTGYHFGDKKGVLRIGDYKLIVNQENVELYNLKNDLSETTDLSQSQPERVKEMLARWQSLDQSSQPPLWEPLSKEERNMDKYQYKDYQWLKGGPHYRKTE